MHELAPGRALGLAGGVGHNAGRLDERGWDPVHVDLSPVGQARERLPAKRLGIEVSWVAPQVDTAAGMWSPRMPWA